MNGHRPAKRLPLVLAILLSLAAGPCAVSALALKVEGVRALLHTYEEAGVGSYGATLVFAFGLLVVTIVGALRGAGRAAPWSIAVFFALGPWIAGLLGEHLGLGMVMAAVANADAGSRTAMLAKGFSEAAHASMIGAWLSAALLGVTALIAGIVARGEAAEERKAARALVAAPVLLALFVTVGLAFVLGVGVRAILGVAIAGLASTVAVALAGAGIGKSEAGRVGAASLAAGVASLGTVALAGAADLGLAEARALGGVANFDPEMTAVFVSRGIGEHFGAQLSVYALGLAVLVGLGIAGALVARSGATGRGGWIDAGVGLGCLVVAAAIGLGSHARRVSLLDPLADTTPEGVEPVAMPIESMPGSPGRDPYVIGPDGLRRRDGSVVPWSAGRAALVEALPSELYRLSLVLDARANGHAVTEALAAAQQAGAYEVTLYGGPTAGARDARDAMEWRAPATVARLVWGAHQLAIDLCRGDDPPPEQTARITATGELAVDGRLGPYDDATLTIDPEASAENVARGLGRGYERGRSQLEFCER